MVALDAAYKDPDPLKVAAREVFDMEAKGRNEEHIKIAVDYLVERVSKNSRHCCPKLRIHAFEIPSTWSYTCQISSFPDCEDSGYSLSSNTLPC